MFGLAAGRQRDADYSARAKLRRNLADMANHVTEQMEIGPFANDGSSAGFDLLTDILAIN